MADHGDASDLSELEERVEDLAAEAERPVPRWYRECRAETRAETRKESLDTVRKKILQEVSSRFDPETAGNLAERLEPISDLDLLLEIHGQIRGGMSGPELLAWMDARA